MSKYVEADRAIRATTEAVARCIPILQGKNAKVSLEVVGAISTLPSIDLDDYVPRDYYEKVVSEMAKRNVEAADIVRCKECKWWLNKEHEDVYGWCKHWLRECNADDFCSYGEREGE